MAHAVSVAGRSVVLGANSPNWGAMYVMLDDFAERRHHCHESLQRPLRGLRPSISHPFGGGARPNARPARVLTGSQSQECHEVLGCRESPHVAHLRDERDLPPLNGTASRERIWGWSKPREATNATRKEGTG